MTNLVVINTVPNDETAQVIASGLIERNLAACVQVLNPCQSFYRWEGKVEVDKEVLLIIKTTETAYKNVESFILNNHSYDVPEIIALPIKKGLPDYLNWLAQEVKS